MQYTLHPQTGVTALGVTGASTAIFGVVFHRLIALSTHSSLAAALLHDA